MIHSALLRFTLRSLARSVSRCLGVAAGTLMLGASLPPPAAAGEAVIRIDPRIDRGAISPGIYGSNHRYSNHGTGMWDPDQKQSRPQFDRQHREAGLKFLRYPGGTVGNTFEWKKAIGPVAQRPKIQPFSGGGTPTGVFGAPAVATFGVDEAARWCEANGVAMLYMFGLAYGTPEDAADLIEYLNSPIGRNPNGGTDWATVRAANGHPEPYNIRHFEIANEADGPSQRYWWPFIDSDETRAKAKLPFSPQRDSYAPEFLFGGIARFERQPLGSIDAQGATDFRDAQAKSDGRPGQTRVFRYRPIEPGSDEVYVAGERWTRVAALSTAKGKVYAVNPVTGIVHFGDGLQGDIPPAGAEIAAMYRSARRGFVDCYRAMKAVDPSLKIYAGYESLNVIDVLGDRYEYDGLVVHPYTNQWNVPKAATLDDWHTNTMLSGERLGREIEEYQHRIDRTVAPARRGLTRVIVTEFGAIKQDMVMPRTTTDSSWRYLNVGLYTAQQLLWFMRAHTPHADRHATTVGVLGPAPEFELTPTALVYQLLTRHFGDRLIGIELKDIPRRTSPHFVIRASGSRGKIAPAGTTNLPAGAEPAALMQLDAEASRDAAGNVHVVVINQDHTDAVTATIAFDTATRASTATAEIRVLRGDSLTAFNTRHRPDAVRIETAAAPIAQGKLRRVFPAHSLSVITIPAAVSPR